jgi:16S rRNA (guanine527-N7)-methyltransferase
MPPPDRAEAQAAAAALGLALPDEQADRLLVYLALLQRWNATYNLSAVRDPQAMWLQHVLDCMAVVPAIQRRLAARDDPGVGASATTQRPRILDVGSGGGLPGVVWAILMPQADITCVDAVGKKAAFVRQAVGQLGLRHLKAEHARVESLSGARFDLVTSRAFSSLIDLVRLTRLLLADRGYWVAMKGKPPRAEITALGWPDAMFHVEPITVPGLAAERCLVWIGPASAAPAAPADPAPRRP